MTEGYDMLAIPLPCETGVDDEARWLVIEASGSQVKLSSQFCPLALPSGWKARPAETTATHPPIVIRECAGQTTVRLLETQTYEWRLEGSGMDGFTVKSPLEIKNKQRWTLRTISGRAPEGQFTVINHLGFSSIQILDSHGECQHTTPLEFVSKKMDFDTEYRRMTEDIADFCEQLLLTWDAPTSLKFSPDPTQSARLLLEQFLFLRNFLTPERLGRLLEVITRKPHSRLIAEHEWKPASMAMSSDFLSHPGKMLRSWHKVNGRHVPSEVLDVRKEDSHDTAPNQFVRFALTQFRQLCHKVLELKGEDSTVGTEAYELMMQLDAITARPFFRSISRLNRLPLDNQTLQKGEGYREVLRAWLLTEAAASLNWEGQEDSYEGSTRDVATLYEYWIFLKLHEILDDIGDMQRLSGPPPSNENIAPFISENTGEILIHLKSGQHSGSRFLLPRSHQEDLRIDLHYERTFSKDTSATSGGSYSRRFRPDYTLSIFPAKFDSEKEAASAGKVAHLHFDAKYRATKLSQVFGLDDDSAIEQEKRSTKATSTYQRGDLLKMHTYNDALRQTIGSYVLYPGDATDKTELRKFHEIAPGVGALIMKPGKDECLDSLKAFLTDIFDHQSSQFTQYRYTSDTHHQIIEENYSTLNEDQASYYVARPNAPCVLIWLKKKTAVIFKEHGFAYCHAVPRGQSSLSKKLDLNLSIEIGSEFIPCGGGQGQKITGFGWRAKITSARFMSKEKLNELIENKKLSHKLKPTSVDHYLVFEFKDTSAINTLDLDTLHKKYSSNQGSKYMAVTCSWKEILDAQPSSTK